MDGKQAVTIALASGRVAFGLGLVAAPARIGSSWLGPDGFWEEKKFELL